MMYHMLTRGVFTVSAVAAALLASTVPAVATESHTPTANRQAPFTFAVIGDLPYGHDQAELFPSWIEDINADPDVATVIHLGDTKSGSTECSDDWNNMVLERFNSFEDPLLYTPGDNEWTDCHREKAGQYNPLERLDAIRATYFSEPHRTLGQNREWVISQPFYPENVLFWRDDVVFSTVHVVGSNNGHKPWTGLGLTKPTREQEQERHHRTRADRHWIRGAFATAHVVGARAVVLNVHADMFYYGGQKEEQASKFRPIVREIAREASQFDGPVYIFNGDTHEYLVDTPLADGSPWLDFYDVDPAPNLTRVQIDGDVNATNWVKVTVNPSRADGEVLTWKQVPFSANPS